MPRPVKIRRVDFFPKKTYFIPLDNSKEEYEEIILKLEELEAIRLKDIKGLNQEECADHMQISRQTFQNILDSARKKVAIFLTEGKSIRIKGGNYTSKQCKFTCLDCGDNYGIKYEQDKYNCPNCGSKKIACNNEDEFCEDWCNI